jgi:hypothetical protein
VRAVDEGLSTCAKPEVETIGVVSDMPADVLEGWSNFAGVSAGGRIRFSILGVLDFVARGLEGVGLSNLGVVAPSATDGSRSSAEYGC